jgi:hypothetical protein
VKKIFVAKTLRIVVLFTQKSFKNLDLGSGIQDPGSRVKRAPDPGVGSATLVTAP